MSLRLRLSVIILVLFLLSTGVGALYIVLSAKDKVHSEIESVATLTAELLGLLINTVPDQTSADTYTAILEALRELQDIRHLDIQVNGDDTELIARNNLDAGNVNAPDWFVHLVKPTQENLVFSLRPPDGQQLLIFTNSYDEIEEAWEETKTSLLLAFSIAALFALTLFFFLGRWLKPVQLIAEGIDAAEHGDYSQRISNVVLPELNLIAGRFNHLNEVLSASKQENDRLKQRALEIQEQERRHLAQELHDEMGQTISAIKAIAVTDANHRNSNQNHSKEIEQLADRIYDSVRNMIGRLRPTVLDELGLIAALQQMTDDWNEHHGDTFCSLKFSGLAESGEAPLTEHQQIHVYRIVQEALTNVAKHAQASLVKIVLNCNVDQRHCELLIEDDGTGFDTVNTRKGMGLNGIEERANALQGKLIISSSPKQGVSIQLTFSLSD